MLSQHLDFFKGDDKGNQSLILPKVKYGPSKVTKFVTLSSSYQIELEGKTLSSVSSSAPRIELLCTTLQVGLTVFNSSSCSLLNVESLLLFFLENKIYLIFLLKSLELK